VSLLWETVKMLAALGIILIAVVYVIKLGVVRLQPDYYNKKGSLKIVERLPLSQKSGLFLVKAGESYFLLGVSTDNINMLAKLCSEELPPADGDKEFKNCLDKYMTNTGKTSFTERMRSLAGKKQRGGHCDD